MLGLRGGWGETFNLLNVSETATHVTGRYVSQQCQMRMRNGAFYSHALGIYYEAHKTLICVRGQSFENFGKTFFFLKSSSR
jgi:hypothetical protein